MPGVLLVYLILHCPPVGFLRGRLLQPLDLLIVPVLLSLARLLKLGRVLVVVPLRNLPVYSEPSFGSWIYLLLGPCTVSRATVTGSPTAASSTAASTTMRLSVASDGMLDTRTAGTRGNSLIGSVLI